ncbi:hypothetical protein HRbin33_01712 [bacterium HR33]|nr:hypothetical protein HRbin33_01712 [bacterium HR33]
MPPRLYPRSALELLMLFNMLVKTRDCIDGAITVIGLPPVEIA